MLRQLHTDVSLKNQNCWWLNPISSWLNHHFWMVIGIYIYIYLNIYIYIIWVIYIPIPKCSWLNLHCLPLVSRLSPDVPLWRKLHLPRPGIGGWQGAKFCAHLTWVWKVRSSNWTDKNGDFNHQIGISPSKMCFCCSYDRTNNLR